MAPGAGEIGNGLKLDADEASGGKRCPQGRRVVADADQWMGVRRTHLQVRLKAAALQVGQREVCAHEWVSSIDSRHHKRPTRAKRPIQVAEGDRWIDEVLDRKVRQDERERVGGQRRVVLAKVDRLEFVEVLQRRIRGVLVDTDELVDPVAEPNEW